MNTSDRTLLVQRIITGAFMYAVAMLVVTTFFIALPPPEEAQFRVALTLLVIGFALITAAGLLAPKALAKDQSPSIRMTRTIILLALREAGAVLGFVATFVTGDRSYVLVLALVAIIEMGRSWPRRER